MKNLLSHTEEWRDETMDVEHIYEARYRRMCNQMAFSVSNSRCTSVKTPVNLFSVVTQMMTKRTEDFCFKTA